MADCTGTHNETQHMSCTRLGMMWFVLHAVIADVFSTTDTSQGACLNCKLVTARALPQRQRYTSTPHAAGLVWSNGGTARSSNALLACISPFPMSWRSCTKFICSPSAGGSSSVAIGLTSASDTPACLPEYADVKQIIIKAKRMIA